MSWVAAVACTVLMLELWMRLPLLRTGHDVLRVIAKAGATLQTPRVSDHWKEIALRRYACRLAVGSLKLLGLFGLAAVPSLIVGELAELAGVQVFQTATSWTGLLVCSGVAGVYAGIRSRFLQRHGAN
jgi:hypothetical protein